MDKHERRALFREHAVAMIRDDQPTASRAHRLIYPDQMIAHTIFVFALFATVLIEHFGDELDRDELSRTMAALRAERSGFASLKAEALVRVVYGESQLYVEIPQAEHGFYMWAVITHLIGPDRTEDHLTELFGHVDLLAKGFVESVFESSALAAFYDGPDPIPSNGSEQR
ncbi:hypothetical protein L0U85_02045 [Glycomyces sp. L485]|uniref:hypothetical protein n=1 Tax=Glycomyces sp. L485 TaxID=2909235 RepID=UPI001F4ACACC|nr:hypothetical protein [Glycomyces sp. L485]MCH7229648.1 hypothetical protein [Glycomyces sp. L485]